MGSWRTRRSCASWGERYPANARRVVGATWSALAPLRATRPNRQNRSPAKRGHSELLLIGIGCTANRPVAHLTGYRVWPYSSYGHSDSSINVFLGLGHRPAARASGRTLENIQVRSAATRNPSGVGADPRYTSRETRCPEATPAKAGAGCRRRSGMVPGCDGGAAAHISAPSGSPAAVIHFDTSFLIRSLLVGSPECERLEAWTQTNETFAISAIAWTEFLCGPLDATAVSLAAVIVDHRLDYTAEVADLAAQLFNGTGRRRNSLTDCMIAATAIAGNAPIATSNPRDFRRFETHGLTVARV